MMKVKPRRKLGFFEPKLYQFNASVFLAREITIRKIRSFSYILNIKLFNESSRNSRQQDRLLRVEMQNN